jgi:hypothetical protein
VRNQLDVNITVPQYDFQFWKSLKDLRLFDQEKFMEVRDKGEGQLKCSACRALLLLPASLKEFSAVIAAFLPRTSA